MKIFGTRSLKEASRAKIPTALGTVRTFLKTQSLIVEPLDKVKNDAEGRCSDAVAKAILMSSNSEEKIEQVNKALDDLDKIIGKKTSFSHPWTCMNADGTVNFNYVGLKSIMAGFDALESEVVAKQFVEQPDAFVEIAKAAKGSWCTFANEAFLALGSITLRNKKVEKMFVQSPNIFVEIAKATRGIYVQEAFTALGDEEVAEQFVEQPDNFVEIAKATKGAVQYAFEALGNRKVAKLLDENPVGVINSFVEIAKASLSTSMRGFYITYTSAFTLLKEERVANLFVKHPSEFGEIAKATITKMTTGDTRSDIKNVLTELNDQIVAKLFAEHPNEFVEIAKAAKDATARVFNILGSGGRVTILFREHPNEFVEIAKAAGLSTADAFTELTNEEVANQFRKNPNEFVEIAKIAGEKTPTAFWALGSDTRARLLFENPHAPRSELENMEKTFYRWHFWKRNR